MNYKKIILTISFLAVFGLLFVPIGSTVKAQTATAADIEALIISLKQQIAQLQAQIAQLQVQQGATPAWCHNFNTNLRVGDSGPEVDALYVALIIKEALASDRGSDSNFDEYLASAVVEFQEKYASEILAPYGLRRGTGYVGPSTRKKLNKLYGCGTTPPTNQPSATILTATQIGNPSPYIIGTASGVSQIWVALVGPYGDGVYKSGLVPVVNGNWSVTVSPALTIGLQYTIYVYDANSNKLTSSPLTIVSSTQPSIKDITSPGNLTNEFYPGDQATIWGANFSANGTVWIGSTSANYQGSEGSLILFTVPTSLTAGTYKLYMNGPATLNSNIIQVKVLSKTTQPSITVTSPNGGETWELGKTYEIKWKTEGYDSNADVALVLYENSSSLPVYNTFKYVKNTGDYKWTLPLSFNMFPLKNASDKYKIRVDIKKLNSLNWEVNDISDNYFSIVAPTNTITCTGQTLSTFDYFTKGTTSNSKGDSLTDYCASGVVNNVSYNLIKGYCNPDGSIYTGHYLCSNGCSNGACVKSTTQTSITVTSPNGGELWQLGGYREVKWISSGVDKVYIMFKNDGNGQTCIYPVSGVSASGGKWGYSPLVGTTDCPESTLLGSKMKVFVRSTSSTSSPSDISDNYFTIVPACKYASVLDDNHDGTVTRTEGEAVITRAQATIGSKIGDANYVAAYDTTGDGRITSLDILYLTSDLLSCASVALTSFIPNTNDQLLASISDAIARIAEAIKEMLNK
ncbi:MAG: hypothetical protein Q7R49_00610 [Candidatus Daviesbacteria bacterium]|nr:hypothetical protein [Candidatus Daviesbacteria bacterium]